MTATDQPTPQVGDTITTVEQLDALPVGSALLRVDGQGIAILQRSVHTGRWYLAGAIEPVEPRLPATVLYRPDAPHPAPVDEVRCGHPNCGGTDHDCRPFRRGEAVDDAAVERAVREVIDGYQAALDEDGSMVAPDRRAATEGILHDLRTALAAARAGEVEQ